MFNKQSPQTTKDITSKLKIIESGNTILKIVPQQVQDKIESI